MPRNDPIFKLRSRQVEAVQIHYFVPRRHEVLRGLLFRGGIHINTSFCLLVASGFSGEIFSMMERPVLQHVLVWDPSLVRP